MVPEYRAITTLLPRVALGTLLILLAGTFIANNDVTGSVNKPMYLVILALGCAITAVFLRSHRSTRFDAAVALIASAGLLWGIWTIERPALLAHFWEGFGYRVALAVVVLVLLLGTVLRPQTFTRPVRIGLGVIVAVCCVCDLLALIRTFGYMPFVDNNLNVINDMLGPLGGNAPDSAFIPQYTSLYGWLFVPFKHVLSPTTLVGAMALFLTVLNVATVVLAVWIVKRLLGTRGFVLPIALVVPITYVTTHFAGDQSSIASLFQEVPIRLFAGFLVAAFGLKDLALLYRGTVRPGHLVLIGLLCGVVAWNSQDFGLAAAGVYGITILFGSMPSARMRALGAWAAGLLLGAASYPLFLAVIGAPPNLGFIAAYIKLFGSGLGKAPMQVPGPVLIVMPIIVCSTAVGWALVILRRRAGIRPDALVDEATVALAFVGTWSTVCLAYYVNRAFAAGQMQTMLLPCGVLVAALLAVAIRTDEFTALWPAKLGSMTWTTLSDKVKMVPVGIFVCLCIAAALLTTIPFGSVKTLLQPPAMSGYATYDLPQIIGAVQTAQRYTADKSGTLTYLGESFNFVSFDMHVPSGAVLFPYSFDAADEDTGVTDIECQYLDGHHSKWMVLSADGLAAFGSAACGIYRPVALQGLAYGQLQEYS
jgi:hypothetical protein